MRKRKTELRKTKDLLWELCRTFFKNKYLKNGQHFCFTCDKPIEKANCQLGHFIPSKVGGALLRYHPNNLRLQCYYDNINLGGNGSEFYPRLIEEIGQKEIDKLFALKHKSIKADLIFYNTLIELYKDGDEKKIVEYLESLV